MDFSSLPNILFCLIICASKILEISLSSIKTVFLVKGQKVLASLLAFVECMVWGLIVSGIITDLHSNLWWLIAYCAGYALGFFIGSSIEGKLAIGTMDVQVVVPIKCAETVEAYLKESGYGYYACDCHGASGNKEVITIIMPRRKAKGIRQKIDELCDGETFVMNFDVSYSKGGYGVNRQTTMAQGH